MAPTTTTTLLFLLLSGVVEFGCFDFTVAKQSNNNPKVVVNEREVLLELYQATGGDSWTNNNGWAQNLTDLCAWNGVLCRDDVITNFTATTTNANGTQRFLQNNDNNSNSTVGTVMGLRLRDNMLAGRIPTSLWTLPSLTYLDVSNNEFLEISFAGVSSHVSSPRLQALEAYGSGSVSLTGISAMAENLISISLSGSELESTIPQEMFQLTNLHYLHVAKCALRGSLSSSISQLSSLLELDLAQNELTGKLPATSLGQLVNLQVLAVSKNQFVGNLPTSLNALTQLKELQTGDNGFTGPLLALNQHPDLYRIHFENNVLTGTIPSNFLAQLGKATVSNSDVMYEVNLAGNRLVDSIPETTLNTWQGLQLSLSLANNQFTSLPMALCGNTNWNQGAVTRYACAGIVCPVGMYSPIGHAFGKNPCQLCKSADFIGATTCLEKDDLSILKALYQATNGANWKKHDNWMDNNNYCTWYGVKCWESNHAGTGHVQHLLLPNNGIMGTIPDTIFHLRYLTRLDLSQNSDAVVPFTNIGDNVRIASVNVAGTRTTNFAGLEFANNALNYLYADRVPIDGTLPTQIYAIQTLQVLSIAESGLLGSIGTEIGQIGELEELYLYGNELRGVIPTQIGQLQKLRIASLAKNQLTGTLPEEMQLLPNLEALSLTDQITKGGGLTGPVYPFLGSRALTNLHLGSNKLDGPIPDNLLSNSPLDLPITVDLSYNNINGSAPGGLAKFTHMNIYLEGNEISGIDHRLCSLDGWMGGLVGEFHCDAILCPGNTTGGRQSYSSAPCQRCTTTANSSSFFGNVACVNPVQKTDSEREVLELLFNQCGGVGWHVRDKWMTSQHVCTWYGISCDEKQSVVSISLGANQLLGTVPTEIFTLPKLEQLSFYSNKITMDFDGIENARYLKSLKLDSTGLDSLHGIGGALALTDLNVRYNKLSGEMPNDLSRLENLRSLVIADNELSGDIPFWISSMPYLTTFNAANNQISGSLYDFGDMTRLVYIDLSNNQIQGSIPVSLLQKAPRSVSIVLDLSNNAMSGTIPSTLASFQDLSLRIANNRITGIDPQLCSSALGWNANAVKTFGCDAILCPVGKANVLGRQISDNDPCIECKAAQYMGSTACARETSSASYRAQLSWILGTAVVLTVWMIGVHC